MNASARGETRRRRGPSLLDLLSAAALIGWTVVAFLYRDPHYDDWAVLGSSAMLGSALGFFRWKPTPARYGYRLLGLAVSFQAFVSTGFSVILEVGPDGLLVTPRQEAFTFAVLSMVVFCAMFLLGAWMTGPRGSKPLEAEVGPTSGPSAQVNLAIALIAAIVSSSSLFLPGLAKLGTLPLLLFNTGAIAPMLVAQGSLTRQRTWLPMAVLLVGPAATTFYTSLLGALVLTLRDMLFARIYLRKRLPRGLMAAMLGIVLILNPAKALFRGTVSTASARTMSGVLDFGQASSLWVDAVSDTWSRGAHGGRDRSEGIRSTTSRLNYNWVPAHVYTVVPWRVPFQDGGTYSIIPAVLVPRILYPDKPNTATYGRAQWFIKLGIQDRRAVETAAFALPAPAEAFWNFGWPGVFLIPIPLGAAVGMMLRWGPRDPVARVGYLVLLATTLGQFLDMLVWLVPQLVVVAAAGWLATVYCRVGRGRLLSWGSTKKARSAHVPPACEVPASGTAE